MKVPYINALWLEDQIAAGAHDGDILSIIKSAPTVEMDLDEYNTVLKMSGYTKVLWAVHRTADAIAALVSDYYKYNILSPINMDALQQDIFNWLMCYEAKEKAKEQRT